MKQIYVHICDTICDHGLKKNQNKQKNPLLYLIKYFINYEGWNPWLECLWMHKEEAISQNYALSF